MPPFEFQAVLDAMADAVIASDETDLVTYVNPAAERLLGWTAASLVGRHLTTLMPARMRAAHEAGFHRYMSTGTSRIMGRPVRVPALRNDGAEIDVELTLSALDVGHGRRLVIASLRDLRDRVELERQLVAQSRLRAQFDVMVALAESATVEEAAPRILSAIGGGLGWRVGMLWIADDDRLRVATTWNALGPKADDLVRASSTHAFAPGEGLPGRVWTSGRPLWIDDVQNDAAYPRAASAATSGLHAALAFPLIGVRAVVGVAEVYGEARAAPDAELLEALATLGRQVGQFVDRVRAERGLRDALASLRRSETRFRTLAEATSDIVWTTDPAGDRLIESTSWRAFTGQSEQELAEARVGDTVHPEDRERVIAAWRDAVARQSPLAIELRLRRADGVYVPMLMRAAPVREDGHVREWVGTMSDVSERRRDDDVRRFLAEASDVLSSSLDYATTLATVARLAVPRLADWCLVEIADGDGRSAPLAVVHVDPEKEKLALEINRRYPAERDAPVGVPHVLRTGRSELYAEISDALLVSVARDEEHLRLLRTLGLHSAMVVPITTRRGTVGAITLISAEARRRFDARDLAIAEDLARRAALAVENATAYDEAKRAVRARDEFLSIASHELRTPLTSVQLQVNGLARMLAKGDVDPNKLAKRVATTEEHVARLGTLISDLLDVSRAQAARIELTLESVDLSELVRSVVDRLGEQLASAGCAVELDLADGIVGRWDRLRVDQVVTNFVTNAMKYGAKRPIEIRTFRDGASAVISVRDHGIGIAPADQARVFERFTRAVSSEHYGGLGLGLWIVRLLVERMGGRVDVDSAPGQGATFCARLPLGEGGVGARDE